MSTTKPTRLGPPRESTRSGKRAWRTKFLKSLAQIPNVTLACEAAQINRTTAYGYRELSKAFAKKWDDAVTAGIERLEARCWIRASVGLKRGVWMKDDQGKPTKVETIYDHPYQIAALLLKAHKPSVYREQRDVLNLNATTTAPDGTKAEFVVHLSAEELP